MRISTVIHQRGSNAPFTSPKHFFFCRFCRFFKYQTSALKHSCQKVLLSAFNLKLKQEVSNFFPCELQQLITDKRSYW